MIGHQDSKYLGSRLTVPKACTVTGFFHQPETFLVLLREPCKAMTDVGWVPKKSDDTYLP